MLNMKAVFIVILFLISSFFFPVESEEFDDNSKSQAVNVKDNQFDESDVTTESSLSVKNRALPTNCHGGSWEDSFDDDSGIDWSMSDNLYLKEGSLEFDITYNPVALWHFEKGSGTTAYDETEHNNDGTLNNGVSWITGKFGKALYFDGVDDYVEVPHNNKLVFGYGPFSLCCWIKIDSSETSYQNLIAKGDIGYTGDAPNQYNLMLEGSNGYPQIDINDNSMNNYKAIGDQDLRDDQWHYIVGTRNYDTLKLFIDGELKDTETNSNIVNFNVGGNGPLAFSHVIDYDPARDLHGTLDEVVIYDRALSAVEVKDHYENWTNRNLYNGNVTSKVINLPSNMHWDTFQISKSQPENTYINITILNSSNNEPLPGSPIYLENGEFDISYIDPIKYPSIKLNATFECNGFKTPSLHYWGVSWNASNTWCDTLMGGTKFDSSAGIESAEGNAELPKELYDNTVALLRFNEGSGATVYDETSNDVDGTLIGPTWTTGKYGNALSFDGIDDYINYGDAESLDFGTGDFTIAAWLNVAAWNEGGIFYKLTSFGGGNYQGFSTSMRNNGDLRFEIGDAIGITRTTFGASVPTNTWTHIALVVDRSNKVNLYQNGVKTGSFTITADQGDISNSASFIIAKDPIANVYYNGKIDDVWISDVARTAQEIKAVYDHGPYKYPDSGILTSEIIALPPNMYWDTLIINKTEDVNNYIDVKIIDPATAQFIPPYENMHSTEIDISSTDPHIHSEVQLQAAFTSDSFDTALLHDWSVNWTMNKAPKVIDITGPPRVYRNNSIRLTANLSDKEDEECNLMFDIKYKGPSDTSWQDAYLSSPVYDTDCWELNFSPPKTSVIGDYTFNISCRDSFDFKNIFTHPFIIEVLNNIPSQPKISLSPLAPRTTDDLNVKIIEAQDLETPKTELEFWYHWYKDDIPLPEFENKSKINSTNTTKSDMWRCEVYTFDGEDIGSAGSAGVKIQNSPPRLVKTFYDIMIEEDCQYTLEDELVKVFSDPDNDVLTFSASGQLNITVDINQENGTLIITPEANWFGKESITFYANDSEAHDEETIDVFVAPTNDLPNITQVGSQLVSDENLELEFMVKQDDWLNLTIQAEDIDGDVSRGLVKYVLNITERENFYFNESSNTLIFNPKNSDVGWHYIEIKVTDNNETPVQYISQKLKINVLNVNDPPSVKILEPEDGIELSQNSKITFSCTADDIDFLIPNSTEKLTYRWYARTPEIIELGTGKELVSPKLPPGQITITIEVKDTSNITATDSILISVNKAKSETAPLTSNSYFWLVIILVLIIILALLIFLITARHKRRKAEAVKAEVVTPTIIPSPYTGVPLDAAPVQDALTATPTPTAAAAAQLPQTVVPTTTYTMVEGKQEGAAAQLTPAEKLKLLEDRLIKGEISEEVYRDLKAKIEMEIQAIQPEPIPQLPAAENLPEKTPPAEAGEQEQQQSNYPAFLELPEEISEEQARTQAPEPEPEQIEQGQAQTQQVFCPICKQPLSYIKESNNYYCYQCQNYT